MWGTVSAPGAQACDSLLLLRDYYYGHRGLPYIELLFGRPLGGVSVLNEFDAIGKDMTVADDALHHYRLAGVGRRELHGNLITDMQIGRKKYRHPTAA